MPPPRKQNSAALLVVVVLTIVAVLTAVVIVYVVAQKKDNPRPSAPVATGQAPRTPRPGGIRADELSGTWTGTYTCSGRVRALELTVMPSGDDLEAEFVFYPSAELSGEPHGSYVMSGTFGGGVLDLKGEAWIDQPSGYVMVDLSGVPARAADGSLTLTGTATHCDGVTITKPAVP
ncbi:hypothetical protein [Actinocorallia sp. A-T 12471]|uniref:hypothetical protein n=1 Tax=Actinocorallia sp. A-T 12471 TaxID=3089813 RepID=UPI0029CE019A|nr:hypothetical protein [Actinocorallia sp. A-T 12471]MDX6738160.1 hypothetical protein [Actinocorallia sp. A-T 12471]